MKSAAITTLDQLILGKTYRVTGAYWMNSPTLMFIGRYMGTNLMTNTATFEITTTQTIVFRADVLDTELVNGDVIAVALD